ncbi:MAG: hypothetical protein D4R74_14710 [Betaproteobacteria bacterium]|nr:MAG: hypothetical protein D4R74_14710 [Betaproteobacteria bacterium]
MHYPAGRLLLGLLVLGAAALYSYKVQAASDQPPIPHGVAMQSWQDNGQDGRYLLQLAQGQALKAGKPVIGTVTSDTDCEIDAEGLSHCHNNIKLADGSEIMVIDTHNMHRNRCLGAGDRLSLTGVKGPWIMGTLSKK